MICTCTNDGICMDSDSRCRDCYGLILEDGRPAAEVVRERIAARDERAVEIQIQAEDAP